MERRILLLPERLAEVGELIPADEKARVDEADPKIFLPLLLGLIPSDGNERRDPFSERLFLELFTSVVFLLAILGAWTFSAQGIAAAMPTVFFRWFFYFFS